LEPTRILLVGLPRLLEEIVTRILAETEDLVLVGVTPEVDSLARVASRTRPNVVVVQGADRQLVTSLFLQDPRVALLAIDEGARRSSLCLLKPECNRVGDLSPESLVAAIRDAAGSASALWSR
jgi:hypothetical protein